MVRGEVLVDGGARILVVVGGVPHPSVGASVVLYHHYIEGLRREGYRILNLMLLQPDNSDEAGLDEYRARLQEGEDFQIVTCRSPRFVQTSRYRHAFDHAALTPVRAQIEAFQPQVTLCLDFASAWAVEGWSVGSRVVWLGDLNFQTFLHHALYSLKEGEARFRHVAMALWHAWLWRRLYRRVLRPCESVVVSSKSSERHLAALGVHSGYQPYPWPAEPPPERMGVKAERPTFFFFGQLQGLGSRSAFHVTVEGIYPRLVRTWGKGGFEILIGGRGGLPAWVEAAIADKPEFRYLGFVEDLDEIMGRCHALLAPIDVPVGNRSRILTALSKRMVVVAHVNTALGNPDLVDGRSCYLADGPDAYVERLRRAVDNPEEAAAVAERGFQVYKRLFAPDVAVAVMNDIIRATLSGRVK
ncbi:MAG: glycosyltransferase [Magnetospirillum sp.]|nr:glycosyltransferase [Magnetospirillum sp.]